ncbi:MAG: hypothetical protein ACP5P9_05160 [Acidimicrobiales bacterium]
MPTRSLQFDGPDLEEVLEQAIAEAGPGGRIVTADRVRKGGVAGFFAREHFEVTVEIDDEPAADDRGRAPRASGSAPGPRAPGTASPRSVAELADDTEDVVELSSEPALASWPNSPSTTGPTTNGSSLTGPSTTVATSVEAAIAGRRSTGPTSGPATAPAQSADRVDASTGAGASDEPLPSTARPSFASLLAGIARDTAFSAGTDVLSGAERAVTGDAAVTAASTAATGHGPAAPPVAAHGPLAATGTSADHRRAVDPFADAATLGCTDRGSGAALVRSGSASVMSTGNGPAAPAADDHHHRVPDGPTACALAELGLPGPMFPAPDVLACLDTLATTEDAAGYLQLALSRSLHDLPPAPPVPSGSGRLLVVAGELDRAWELARRLAVEAGSSAGEVHVAAAKRPRRRVERRLLVTGPDDADLLMAERRRTSTVTVVALDAPVSARPDPFCHDLLDALVPTAVWGVVSATHKAEDVAAWAEALGGLDALAVADAVCSTTPGSLLELGIPVASLDGQPATPALWAAVLVGQLLLARGGAGTPGLVEG